MARSVYIHVIFSFSKSHSCTIAPDRSLNFHFMLHRPANSYSNAPKTIEISQSPRHIEIEAAFKFLSYQLTSAQGRWHTTEREAFAVYNCMEEAHWLLHGSKFPVTVYTDHAALVSLLFSPAFLTAVPLSCHRPFSPSLNMRST